MHSMTYVRRAIIDRVLIEENDFVKPDARVNEYEEKS